MSPPSRRGSCPARGAGTRGRLGVLERDRLRHRDQLRVLETAGEEGEGKVVALVDELESDAVSSCPGGQSDPAVVCFRMPDIRGADSTADPMRLEGARASADSQLASVGTLDRQLSATDVEAAVEVPLGSSVATCARAGVSQANGPPSAQSEDLGYIADPAATADLLGRGSAAPDGLGSEIVGRVVAAHHSEVDQFCESIQKPTSTPMAPKISRARPAPLPSSDKSTTRRCSKRLANNKLSRVPVARRGEVLLMRRLDILDDSALVSEAARRNLSTVFHDGLLRGHADAINGAFPPRKAAAGEHAQHLANATPA